MWLSVILILTLAFGYLGVNGTWLDQRGLYKLMPWIPTLDTEQNWPKTIVLGLDLKGGVYVEYLASQPDDEDADFDALLAETMDIMRSRLAAKGYAESTVVKLGSEGIRVEIPNVTNAEALLRLVGSPAKLEFRLEDGTVFMEGKDVKTAEAQMQQTSADGLPEPLIHFELTPEGAVLFDQATAENIGKRISIYLGDTLLTSPVVQSRITGGSGVITGMSSIEQAKDIAIQIQSGALPLLIKQQTVDVISASMGPDALKTLATAVLMGLLLVVLLMAVRYRLLGVVADWAFVIYYMFIFFIIAITQNIHVTLPGVSGLILGFIMVIGSHITIFERVNTEIKAGRSVKAAVRAGYTNALSTIMDAHVVIILVGIILLLLGDGRIQGFAATLVPGAIVSVFITAAVTRFLLSKAIDIGLVNPGIYVSKGLLTKEVQ